MPTSTRIDLSRLAYDRASRTTAAKPKRRQSRGRFVARVVLPGLILLGFATMAGWAARDLLRQTVKVTVVPVVVRQAAVQQSGSPLFQAAGWVEPRPTPTYVSAFASGIVAELRVVAGQEVTTDEVIARLIDRDAQLAVHRAHADLDLADAMVAQARAELTAAEQLHATPLPLSAAAAEAEALLAVAAGELAAMPSQVQAAEATLKFAEQSLLGRQAAGNAISTRLLQESESTSARIAAELDTLKVKQQMLPRQVEALQKRRDVLARQVELRIEEKKRYETAQADLQAAEARKQQAEVALEVAELRLERMTVTSPMNGRVLTLLAGPGSFVTGQQAQSNPQASAVVSLYDPAMLQVRADVRLQDVPQVTPGQPVFIETEASSVRIPGVVLEATSTANVQKNTLEVKVALDSPPPAVRPEMLVKATFFAPKTETPISAEEQKRKRILVPRRLLQRDETTRTLWIAAADGTARLRTVLLGEAGTEELVEVTEGLQPTDRLIVGGRESVTDGDSIEISGEDPAT